VTWNSGNGLAASGLLASATASGLCRIDLLEGRWMKGKIPYTGVANIRRESDVAMDVDADSEDSPSSE
jgi:transcription factor C subunit 6